jgi:hypothetical protein
MEKCILRAEYLFNVAAVSKRSSATRHPRLRCFPQVWSCAASHKSKASAGRSKTALDQKLASSMLDQCIVLFSAALPSIGITMP